MSDLAEPAARLAALRAAGASRAEPARLDLLEALARRMEGQPAAVRALLRRKLDEGIAACERRVAGTAAAPVAAPPRGATVPRPAAATALAALAVQLHDAGRARVLAVAPGEPAPEHELASARRFRQAWQASRTLDQVEQALERKPAQAGPLNSHALVLHSLARMRELSPAYLRRFLEFAETLQWLEQGGGGQPPSASPKPVRKRRKGRAGDA